MAEYCSERVGPVRDGSTGCRRYPWYDSVWLSKYTTAKDIIRTAHPAMSETFADTFRVLHTRPDFKTRLLEHPFDKSTLSEIRALVASLKPTDLELREARRFGRFVVTNHPYFCELQQRAVPLVSGIVGERVEAMYNFLSLYTRKGVCSVHMDAPNAKWTLDLCIDQSTPWPIYLSDVQPWPESFPDAWTNTAWEDSIRGSQSLRFTEFSLRPGQALIFSGSSQWHYRNHIPSANPSQFSTLLFLHFIPAGTAEIVDPSNWARLFGVSELENLKL